MLISIPREIGILNFEDVTNDVRIVRIQTLKLCTKCVYLLPRDGFDSWRPILKLVLPAGTWIEPTFFRCDKEHGVRVREQIPQSAIQGSTQPKVPQEDHCHAAGEPQYLIAGALNVGTEGEVLR